MSAADWIVLSVTLTGIILYGIWRGRGEQTTDDYLVAGRTMPWYAVLLGIMATQASAITFISAPGQAYTDGMRFVQYYFGLPLAMVVISVTFIPIFRKQNVYTAYEYLEKRFDRRTRILTSFFFLLSRGLSTGISIYAPSIILSSIFGWNIYLTNVLIGGLLMTYSYRGGARAIAYTQPLQFSIIMCAMVIAGITIIMNLPPGVSAFDAVYLAGKAGKLNVISTDFDLNDKYNIFSGLIGGFFLALSYFGTDQSQVGRYLTGKGVRESRLGLLMNGIVKIPMQLLILLVGALLVVFYSMQPAPLFFNEQVYNSVKSAAPAQVVALDNEWKDVQDELQRSAVAVAGASETPATPAMIGDYRAAVNRAKDVRERFATLASRTGSVERSDVNYIFLHFVRTALPVGLAGLLIAVVFLASWGSISAAFHALASSSMVDIHLLLFNGGRTDKQQMVIARMHNVAWGVFCIMIAMFAANLGSLIEAVNILGSLFYGTLLGIFLTAFYLPRCGGRSVFTAALVAEVVVVTLWILDVVSFLWLNVVGAGVVMIVSMLVSLWSGYAVRSMRQ